MDENINNPIQNIEEPWDGHTFEEVEGFIKGEFSGKQDTLVSGETIKTINNIDVLGSGNIVIPKGEDAVNPFKGWFDSSSALSAAYPSPKVGDYAYIKGASSSDPAAIYECATAGTWTDSGRTVDTSSVQTFASGEEVNDVHIVNDLTTGGEHNVASSEIVKNVADILEISNDFEPLSYNIKKGFYVSSNGVIKAVQSNSYTIAYIPSSNENRKIRVVISDNKQSGTYPQPTRGLFFVDSDTEIANDTTITYIIEPLTSIGNLDTEILVPANKILCITYFKDGYGRQEVKTYLDKGNPTTKLKQDVDDIISCLGINYANDNYNLLQHSTYNVYLKTNNTIATSSSISTARTYVYAASTEDRKLCLKQYLRSVPSIGLGAAFLIDNVSELEADTFISYSNILITPRTINGVVNNTVIDVPANKILCVTTNQTSDNYCNVSFPVIKSQELDNVYNPDYIQENPLDIIKETAGYTAIFRTMGVIGGSMASGSHHVPDFPAGPCYEYSSLQFMARLCGAQGFNFSVGGMSAHEWPTATNVGGASDLFNNNPCQMYLIQLGNNDVSFVNPESTEYDPTYSIGEVSDVNGNNGVFANTFYGKMGEILHLIRQVQPRAYIFLSTFLKGYGTIPPSYAPDFDYNAAIRNIVDYYTENDGANRPEGDGLHYYLIDYYTYGKPYSYYYNGIHEDTVQGSHLVATGYLLWAYQYCTYIDWIIKNNMSDFNEVACIG